MAQALPHEDLPSLRLVSREWREAANKAVRRLGISPLTHTQLDNLRVAVQMFPGLSTTNMLLAHEAASGEFAAIVFTAELISA